jgi:hypothetical protein
MKKALLLSAFCAVFGLIKTETVHAQITSIKVNIDDSLSTYCVIPSVNNFIVSGNVTGTVSATDSAIVNVNFDDGFDSTFKLKIYPTSGGGSFYNYSIFHTYTFPGTFSPKVKASLVGGLADSIISKPSITISNTCGTLNGLLYVDGNGNCIKDASEKGVRWMPILAINTATSDSSVVGWSNDTGYYYAALPPGTYTIVPLAYHYGSYAWWIDTNLVASCPSSGTYSLTVTSGSSYSKDFAYTCKPVTSYDASINVWTNGFVPGDSTYVAISSFDWLWYYHYTCASLTSTVTLTLDPKLTYLSHYYSLAPSSVSGSTITWTLSSTADVVDFYSSIWVGVSTSATIGDTIRMTAYIAPTSLTDPNLSNNTLYYKKAVASSHDPNAKEVTPTGASAAGFIHKNTELTYTVHFQNTGTAAARNITVTDAIDPNLDLTTLHMINSTHNASMYVTGNTVKFRFENVNLDYSSHNMSASMGAVTYGIKPKQTLAPGAQMTNTAAIYFDYNAPIVTNTTLNTIEIPTNIQQVSLGNFSAKVFPNPANTELNIKVDNNNNSNISVILMDMLGRVVSNESSNNGNVVIATQSMPTGLYIVNIKDNKGNELNTKVSVKH